MQSKLFGAVIAAAVFASGAASAAPATFHGKATLANPASGVKEATVSGVAWRCEGGECAAVAERYSTLDSQMKECRKVVAALGPVASYQSRGREMSKGNLAVCNRASPVQTATAAAPAGE
jgi:hypothetical protein